MRQRRCLLSAFTLSVAVFLSTATIAADLPKEGTFSGDYSAVGTTKASALAKERLLASFDENGSSVGEGMFNRFTWHCWGLSDFANGQGLSYGYCVGTDPAGDQIALDFKGEKQTIGQKIVNGSTTLTAGTGKYAGVTGSGTFIQDGNGFHSPGEGTYISHATYKGSYKLP